MEEGGPANLRNRIPFGRRRLHPDHRPARAAVRSVHHRFVRRHDDSEGLRARAEFNVRRPSAAYPSGARPRSADAHPGPRRRSRHHLVLALRDVGGSRPPPAHLPQAGAGLHAPAAGHHTRSGGCLDRLHRSDLAALRLSGLDGMAACPRHSGRLWLHGTRPGSGWATA